MMDPRDNVANKYFLPGSLSNSSGDLDTGGPTSHIKSGHKVTLINGGDTLQMVPAL